MGNNTADEMQNKLRPNAKINKTKYKSKKIDADKMLCCPSIQNEMGIETNTRVNNKIWEL